MAAFRSSFQVATFTGWHCYLSTASSHSDLTAGREEHSCSRSCFWLIEQQFWCQTCLNIRPSALSSVSSNRRVRSDTAVPAAWISHNKVITHVTLDHLHQCVQSFHFHPGWQNVNDQQAATKKNIMHIDECRRAEIRRDINKSSTRSGSRKWTFSGQLWRLSNCQRCCWMLNHMRRWSSRCQLPQLLSQPESEPKPEPASSEVCQRSQQLMYRCLYLLSFPPLCQISGT